MLRGVWLGLAHLLGAAARALGRGARDLDPTHRRDGLGLALVAGAATLVAATWFGVDGWFVSWAAMVMTSVIGALAWLSPLILLALAWRFLRHPDDNATTGRLVIGAAAVLVGVIGIWHLVTGAATPSDGAEAMGAGGGVVGWIVTAPIVVRGRPDRHRAGARAGAGLRHPRPDRHVAGLRARRLPARGPRGRVPRASTRRPP